MSDPRNAHPVHDIIGNYILYIYYISVYKLCTLTPVYPCGRVVI